MQGAFFWERAIKAKICDAVLGFCSQNGKLAILFVVTILHCTNNHARSKEFVFAFHMVLSDGQDCFAIERIKGSFQTFRV